MLNILLVKSSSFTMEIKKRLLVTGSTGRLGKYIIPLLEEHFEVTPVGIENFDFIYQVPKGEYDLVLHMGAYTDVQKAEKEVKKCFDTNVVGTYNLVEAYKDTPFVYISTEYANKPLGVYALSKQLGEEVVKTHPNYLILRTSFKPNPFPFPYAYDDQYTQGDYVDVIAEELANLLKRWIVDYKNPFNFKLASNTQYLGTGRKTMFEMAQRTRPEVLPNKVDEYNAKIGKVLIPHDYL